jgi:thiamine-phosphate pyrophosphorylase
VGLAYLDKVVREIPLPFVAIGGIKVHNIEEVVRHGAKMVALVTEILGAEDIRATVSELTAILKTRATPNAIMRTT